MTTRLFIFLFILIAFRSIAQNEVADSNKWLPNPPPYYSFIDYDENIITHSSKLDSVLKKLVKVHVNHKGKVTIVHIGDSHLQADMETSILRNGLQDFFGDAGRGIVFPYQLANSNAPHDVSSSSNTTWKSNRIGIDKDIQTGISGFGIHSNKQNATVRIHLKEMDGKQEHFNRMVFFLCNDSACYRLTDSNLKKPITLYSRPNVDTPSIVFESDSLLTGFELCKNDMPGHCDYSFYGVSLERKDTCGVLYHTIGVNGARYDQYLNNPLFWKQLTSLHGDLFIVSLGTNEAQTPKLNEPAFIAVCDSFVHKIHKIAPKACILITTPPGSYFKMKKPNPSVQAVSHALAHYCDEHDVPLWDLNKITDGATGTVAFKRYNLLGHDGIHFTNAGYQLQGLLLLNALSATYNDYYKKHPIKPKPKYIIEYINKPKKPTVR